MVLKETEKRGGKSEREEYLTCLPQLPAADGVPLNLHLPTQRLGYCLHPIRDLVHKIKCGGRGCGEKKSNWREREREGEETPREGKRSGTRGGYRSARNKESVYTNGLADETKQTK